MAKFFNRHDGRFASVCSTVLLLMIFFLLGTGVASAQQRVEVRGVILDETGGGVISAAIQEKGTTNGVISDFNGNYSINVPVGTTLVYSCIGYVSQEFLVQGPGRIDVTLIPDTQMLEETVVVGYGIQKKSDLTGAISSVKEEDLTHRTITSAEQALAGKTAGVQMFSSSAAPGSSPSIRVRGVSSNGSSDPLFVVDGTIVSSIASIEPGDIESMEILKDGASAAIYGARAGNGVVLITTKRGKGDGRVSYEYQRTVQQIAHIPDLMNAAEYVDYYLERGSFTQDKLDHYWGGKYDTNWADSITENGIMDRHTISFQQGNEKGNVYLSLSYLNQDGMFKGNVDWYNRLTGMLNGSWKIKPWVEVTTNNQLALTTRRSVGENSMYLNPMVAMVQMDPLTPVSYSYAELPDVLRNAVDHPETFGEVLKDKDGKYYSVSQFYTGENGNPFIMFNATDATNRFSQFSGTTALNLTPVKGLSITSRIGYNIRTSQSFSVTGDYYRSSTDFYNYASVSGDLGNPVYYQWENFVNYMHDFGKHSLSAMVGSSFSEQRTFSISGSYSGSQGDFGFQQDDPRYLYWAYALPTATKNLSGAEARYYRNLSYFGRVNWNYGNKYLLQASLRADAADSSILPIDNRWGYFPAVSAGWTVSNEEFMGETRSWLSYLKLRASWGQNGSTASLGNYSYASIMASGQSLPYPTATGFEYIQSYVPSSTGNYNLKWETSEQLNFGIDARFFSDRLTFSTDYFRKMTKDLIVTGTKPSLSIGLTVSPINAGNVKNDGFEFELGWQDNVGDLRYSIRANAATLRNKVTYIDPSLTAIDGDTFHIYGAVTRFEVGYPAWHFYGYTFDKIDPQTGDPLFKDLDGDGALSDGDKGDIGSGIPSLTYGTTITLGWKNFDFLLFASGVGNSQIFALLDRAEYATNKIKYFTNDRWTPSNTGGSRPRASANNYTQYLMSSASVLDGSYLKIKQIQLGYSLPSRLLDKVRLSGLRVYASLDDFFTFTSYPGFDPAVTGNGRAMGVDHGTYPTSKKIVFGVNVSF